MLLSVDRDIVIILVVVAVVVVGFKVFYTAFQCSFVFVPGTS